MISFPRLLGRTLVYHRLGALAVLLGVAVGSAVLTGALFVGDSLRGSLRARAERQLGGVEAAALFPRPVRAAVADGMPGTVAPALLLPGSIQKDVPGDPTAAFLGRVTVYGVDGRFAPTRDMAWPTATQRGKAPVVLAHRVAAKLGVAAGDRVRIGVERFSDLPRSSSLAKRATDDVATLESFTVAAVLPADAAGNDFGLIPNPAAPLNVFIPLAVLSDRVRDESDRSDAPIANALLASGASVDELNAALRTNLRAVDLGIRLRVPSRHDRYLSVESDQLVLSDATVKAVEATTRDLGLRVEPTVVYVADTLAHGTREMPYPVIAGLNPAASPPLGPFLPAGVAELKDNEVVLVDWDEVEDPLRGLPAGAKLTMTYYHPDVEGEGKIEKAELTLRGYVNITPFVKKDSPAPTAPAFVKAIRMAVNDRDLTPFIRGITDDRADLFSWDRPPMLPKEKIRARVPDNGPRARFWNRYKATPMAYLNLATARKLFAGKYGSVTSIRVAPAAGEAPDQTAERLGPVLQKHLDPAAVGLRFESVRDRLLTASRGGTDFGGLFLGFSLFLIAAALMLVGLLFRLTLDRRAKEIGLLLATGYGVRHVRRLVLAEGLLLAVVGAGFGLLAAVAYNRLLLRVLLDLWPDPDVAGFLQPHTSPTSFALGFGLTVAMSLVAIWLSVRGLVKVPPPALLRGETTWRAGSVSDRSSGRWVRYGSLVAVLIGIGLIVGGSAVANPDYRAMTFFSGGGLLLAAGLAGGWSWLTRARHAAVNGRGLPALARLGGRNAARNPARSLLTSALLASAAFLLVAVESFRREPGRDFLAVTGGSGGFNLIAEADVPLFTLVDTPFAKIASDQDGTRNVFPLRLRSGDDASCLNLFQASRPRLLGVPDSLIQRGGFQFYQTEARTPEEKANPWLLLTKPAPNDAVPVFAENNTAVWMLKTGVGGEVKVPDDSGNEITLRIIGTFADSPFQSELVMAESQFVRLFPKQEGYRTFLVRTPPGTEAEVGRTLELGLRSHGLGATPTRDRVAAYQAVIGAYLSTFQLLGGFGLLLGVLGLAVVVLRGVWERLGELALLRAVGYRPRMLQFLVLIEHAALLAAGLGIGVLAALASVAPHIAAGAAVPWLRLAVFLALALAVGLGVASAATAGILRVPVIPALRRD